MDRQIQEIAMEEIEPVRQTPGFSSSVIFQPLHENAIREGKKRGGNALGIESDGPLTCKSLSCSALRMELTRTRSGSPYDRMESSGR